MRRLLERLSQAIRGRNTGRPLALLLLALFLALRLWDPAGMFDRMRIHAYDMHQALAPRVPGESAVVIVAIDEASLRRYGQWPWPRDLVAGLVDAITAQQPAAIGLDILFPEPDRTSPEHLLERHSDMAPMLRAELAKMTSHDARLARSLAAAPSVLAVTGDDSEDPGVADFTRPPLRLVGQDARGALLGFPGLLTSIGELDRAASGHGTIGIVAEPDGVVRRMPVVIRVGDAVLPSLALEMLRLAFGAPGYTLEGDRRGARAVVLGDLRIPTEPDGRMWVPFSRHRDERFRSAADVLGGKIAGDDFRDRLVLVGLTGAGLDKVPSTPIGENVNGVEIHAQLLEAMLDEALHGTALLRRPSWGLWLELLLTALAGLCMVFWMPRLPPRRSALPLLAVTLALLGGTFGLYRGFRLLVDPVYPLGASALLFPVVLGFRLAELDREQRRLQVELEQERERRLRHEGEMLAARKIQMGMLPQRRDLHPQLEIHDYMEPARTIGGDLFNFLLLDDRRLFFVIGDVSDKGVKAALFMGISMGFWESAARQARLNVGDILTLVNREVAFQNPEVPSEMNFVTMLAGIFDVTTGELELANAGHEWPFIVRPGQAPERLKLGGGPPACVIDDFVYPLERLRLEPGECLVLFTDGITEAQGASRELYGAERVAAVLATVADDPAPQRVIERLIEDVHRFVGGADPWDDITALALRRRLPPTAA